MERMRSSMFVAALVIAAMLAFAAAEGAEAPSLNDITANVTKAMLPPKGYQVAVTQTVEKGGPAGAKGFLAAPAEVSQFGLNYSKEKGLLPTNMPAPVAAPDAAGTDAMPKEKAAAAPPSVRLSFDVNRVLADLALMDNVVIVSEQLNDRPHWKITGMYGDGSHGLAYMLWVDAGTWTASKFSVRLENQPFSESSFAYGASGSLWLPSRSIHEFPSDGTRVTQDFGAYLLEQ